MESVKLLVQADHKFLTRASIFCRCVTNVKTLDVSECSVGAPFCLVSGMGV